MSSVHVITHQNDLMRLATGLSREVDEGLEQIGERVYSTAYANTAYLTGALRDSLFVEVEDGVATIGYEVEYAPDVELGNATRAAHPALVPAFDAEATPQAVADMVTGKIEGLVGGI